MYNEYTGYISNARILNGTALYTSELTPPTHALEVIGELYYSVAIMQTLQLHADGTGKTVTVNGNAAASTFSPGISPETSHLAQSSRVSQHLILKDILFHHQARQQRDFQTLVLLMLPVLVVFLLVDILQVKQILLIM